MKHNLSKYVFEFLAIFIAISFSFMVEEWREDRQNRQETEKALRLIQFDMQIDTNYYHLRMNRLERYKNYLETGLYGTKSKLNVSEFKQLLIGLRGNVDYQVQKQGIQYLRNNIRLPKLKNDTLLNAIGMYYELSSEDGNYSLLNRDHSKLSYDNYQDLFSFNPYFLDKDTIVANQAIRDNMSDFLNDPYWLGRINLMYREDSRTMPMVFDKNLKFAEHLMSRIEQELNPNISQYPMEQTNK